MNKVSFLLDLHSGPFDFLVDCSIEEAEGIIRKFFTKYFTNQIDIPLKDYFKIHGYTLQVCQFKKTESDIYSFNIM